MRMTTFYGMAVVACTLLSGACAPTFSAPLTAPDTATLDAAPSGIWIWEDSDDVAWLHVGKQDGSVLVIAVGRDEDDELGATTLRGHVSILDDRTFLNLQVTAPDDAVEDMGDRWLIMQYELRDDSLALAFPSLEILATALEDGTLAGDIERSLLGSSIGCHVDSGSATLRAFVDAHTDDLFEWNMVLAPAPVLKPDR